MVFKCEKNNTYLGAGLGFILLGTLKNIKQRKDMQRIWITGWLLSFLSIPLLSLYGRSLQLNIMGRFSPESLGVYLTLSFTGVVCIYGIALYRASANTHRYHLLWVSCLALFFYVSLPFVEKIHIALFGLFGFLSQRIFEQKAAAFFCVVVSFLDELFQHFLAARVGDWRDVWLNLFSASLGMFLAYLIFEETDKKRIVKVIGNDKEK